MQLYSTVHLRVLRVAVHALQVTGQATIIRLEMRNETVGTLAVSVGVVVKCAWLLRRRRVLLRGEDCGRMIWHQRAAAEHITCG